MTYLMYYDSDMKEWTYGGGAYIWENSWNMLSVEIPESADVKKYGVMLMRLTQATVRFRYLI